jgi:peroxiredoxin
MIVAVTPTLRRVVVSASVALAVAAGLAVRATGGESIGEPAPAKTRADAIRSFTLEDLDGTKHSLAETKGANAVVFAWTAAGCPVAMVYAPRLAGLAKDFAGSGVRFFGVSSDAEAPVGELRSLAKKSGIEFPILRDLDGSLAQRLGAKTTTTAVVLDATWRVRYVGAVDDQYGVTGRKEKAEHVWLRDALEALLGHHEVETAATEAPGCPITFATPSRAATADAPTWSGRVAEIVHRRCTLCHQPHQGAPFSLRVFEDARSRTATMKSAITDGRMPPWHAVGEKGRWANDRRLDPEEKDALLAWIDAGAPSGDLSKAPQPPPVPPKDAWDIGRPDAVFAFDKPQKVPAEGVVPYRYIEVPTSFAEDRWVTAMEVRPGAPDVVHHVLVAAVPKGEKPRGRRGAFNPVAGFFAAMVPGARGLRYPDGMAKRLPAGATLLFQVHYTPNGVATTDVTKIGMVFSNEKPEREVLTAGAFAPMLAIPPGEANYQTEGSLPVPWNVHVLAFMPHMHVRGKSFRYAIKPFGQPEQIVCDVPKYDFNWQTPYRLAAPIAVPMGSLLHCTAVFDNSKDNPYNPDPTATVTWGDQTFDEMMIGYVDYVKD